LIPGAELLFEGDWRNQLLQSRPRQEYSIDFSGRTEKTNYFFSAGYLDDKGIFTTQQFNRITGRANVTTKVKKWFELGTTPLSATASQKPRQEKVPSGFCVPYLVSTHLRMGL